MPLSPEYIEYMQSPEWDTIRKRRLALDEYTCQRCGVTGEPLDVHHLTYQRFGCERMSDLIAICRNCHDIEHGKYPVTIPGLCQTCGEFLVVTIERIVVFGTKWLQHTCDDGHIRSYKDE